MKIVSACLAGIKCRWNGESFPCKKVIELVKKGKAIPICPELLGGLTTPGKACEQKGNKIITKDNEDLTIKFKKGAEEALRFAKSINCKEAILKSGSPSCGSGKVYDGSFSGKTIKGDGIFASLLKKNGIKVSNEEEI